MQLWRHALRNIVDVVLEGLSNVKRCTAMGRTAMSSDLQDLGYSLKLVLEPLSKDMAAMLDSSLRMVEDYIKVHVLDTRPRLKEPEAYLHHNLRAQASLNCMVKSAKPVSQCYLDQQACNFLSDLSVRSMQSDDGLVEPFLLASAYQIRKT